MSYAHWSAAERRTLIRALRDADPDLAPADPSADLALDDDVQLVGPAENHYEWNVSAGSLFASWTYFKSPGELRHVLDRIANAMTAIRPLGAVAYDPQIDRDLELPRDADEVVTAYHAVNQSVVHAGVTPTRAKPWWKFW